MASCENFYSLRPLYSDNEVIEMVMVSSDRCLLVISQDPQNNLLIIRGYSYEIIVILDFLFIHFKLLFC
jgi:hypothetical protein